MSLYFLKGSKRGRGKILDMLEDIENLLEVDGLHHRLLYGGATGMFEQQWPVIRLKFICLGRQ